MPEGNRPRGIWVVVVCSLCNIPATFTEITVIYLQANQHLTLREMRGHWQLRRIVESFHPEAFQSFSADLVQRVSMDDLSGWRVASSTDSFTSYDWWNVQLQESPCTLHAFVNGA